MPAPIGNQFWKVRSKCGRDSIFENAEDLWKEACSYFQWVEANPLEKAIVYQGAVSKDTEKLMRPMTVQGFCVHLGIAPSTYYEYAKKKDFSEIVSEIANIIYVQKFDGASAGLLNSNIIARDLGLADTKQLTGTGQGGAIKTESTTFNFIPVSSDD